MKLIHKKKVQEKDLGFNRNSQRQSGGESLIEDLQLLVGRKNVCYKIKQTKIKRKKRIIHKRQGGKENETQ